VNPDLAAVRDEKGLAKLADDERAAWISFWADVAALQKQAAAMLNKTIK
jgi:hypothetical protein